MNVHVRLPGVWVGDVLSPSVTTTHARWPIPSEKNPRSSWVSASNEVASTTSPPPVFAGGDSIATERSTTSANVARSGEGNE